MPSPVPYEEPLPPPEQQRLDALSKKRREEWHAVGLSKLEKYYLMVYDNTSLNVRDGAIEDTLKSERINKDPVTRKVMEDLIKNADRDSIIIKNKKLRRKLRFISEKTKTRFVPVRPKPGSYNDDLISKVINEDLVREAYQFFGLSLCVKNSTVRSLENILHRYQLHYEPAEPIDRFNLKLPIELQLNCLEELPIWEADQAVRYHWPHLTQRWIIMLAPLLNDFFDTLCSTGNMRYIGSRRDYSYRVDYYRPRFMNLHPTVKWERMRYYSTSCKLQSLQNTKFVLLSHFESLIWHKKQHGPLVNSRTKAAVFQNIQIRYNSKAFPFGKRQAERCKEILKQIKGCDNFPFLIPVFLYGQDIPVPRERPYLLLYQDELEEILKNMELVLRPAFLVRGSTSKQRGMKEDWIVDMMKEGMTVGCLMSEWDAKKSVTWSCSHMDELLVKEFWEMVEEVS